MTSVDDLQIKVAKFMNIIKKYPNMTHWQIIRCVRNHVHDSFDATIFLIELSKKIPEIETMAYRNIMHILFDRSKHTISNVITSMVFKNHYSIITFIRNIIIVKKNDGGSSAVKLIKKLCDKIIKICDKNPMSENTIQSALYQAACTVEIAESMDEKIISSLLSVVYKLSEMFVKNHPLYIQSMPNNIDITIYTDLINFFYNQAVKLDIIYNVMFKIIPHDVYAWLVAHYPINSTDCNWCNDYNNMYDEYAIVSQGEQNVYDKYCGAIIANIADVSHETIDDTIFI